jgi:hypothetical protein
MDPHVRIRHDHQLLCCLAPHLAAEVAALADALSASKAPVLAFRSFTLRRLEARREPRINVQASIARLVQHATPSSRSPAAGAPVPRSSSRSPTTPVARSSIAITHWDWEPLCQAVLALQLPETSPSSLPPSPLQKMLPRSLRGRFS